MGFYQRVVFPWLNDRLLGPSRELGRLRSETLSPARGSVIEIGFGTGLNLRHYPEAVTSITAIEPNEGMLARSRSRVAHAHVPIEIVHAPAEQLPFDDASFDTAVSVLTLCTVHDPMLVLSELRRVLRHDGVLLLLEHGLSPDARIARWQHRLNPIQNVLGAGCNLNRPTMDLVQNAGFRFDDVRQFYEPEIPRVVGWMTLGRAGRG